jgi:hypothetical protein
MAAPSSVLPGQDDSLESKRRQDAPIEGPSPANEETPDPCNSQLPQTDPEVVQALKGIVMDVGKKSLVARRYQIRRVRRAELYWQSLQYLWTNPVDGQLYTPTEAQLFDDSALQDQPRYQFVTNIYQAYGLSFIAVAAQDIPDIAFFPEDPNDEDDVTAAKAANDVAELIQRNNDPEKIFWEMAYHAWTGGLIGIYVRYVTDGNKFGWDYLDDMDSGQVMLADGGYVCPDCGAESGMDNPAGMCPECGAQLSDDNVKAPDFANVPIASQQVKLPRGQEVITVYGALELNTPIWCDHQDEFPYCNLQFEVPKAKLKSAYPWSAQKIGDNSTAMADDEYARVARISVKESLPGPMPTDMLYDLITLNRIWVRPWVFECIKDPDVKKRVYELFPDGAYMAFAGDVYCESRNETMDSVWVVRHAMPGRGSNRPAIGDTLMDIQDQVNTERNICMETWEYGIPPIYADSEVLDFDALQNQTAEPGSHYPAKAKQGAALADGFFQPNPAEVNPQMLAEIQELCGPLAQLLTGMYPALFGGDTGDNDTAKGIGIQRDQAMGRVGLPWKAMKEAWCKAVELAVKCFRDNRSDDVSLAQKDPTKKPVTIRLDELKGEFKAYPEADSAFPRMQSDKKAAFEKLLGMAKDIPGIAALFASPSNLEQIQAMEGLIDFDNPPAASRDKQMVEIEELLAGTPQPGVDPKTGLPTGQMEPSVKIGPLDRDQYEFAECERWATDPAGMAAMKTNPAGYANVMLHAQMHQARMQQVAAQANQKETPSESIAYKDLPPDGQIQLAQQAGIKLDPKSVAVLKAVDLKQKMQPKAPPPARPGESGQGDNSGQQQPVANG